MSTTTLLQQVKNDNEDFEWYPTTKEIINTIKQDIETNQPHNKASLSILDIGAGDGRVLNSLSFGGNKFAIEKSQTLINAMDRNIFIIGTDFEQQSLMDKNIDISFCNPPYSQYAQWTTKILNETLSKDVYMVIPSRWKNNEEIQTALEFRGMENKILGSFDFLNADRQARAKVDIVKFYFKSRHYTDDIFAKWFDKEFPLKAKRNDYDRVKDDTKESIKQELIHSKGDLALALETCYNKEMERLYTTYKSLLNVDTAILNELNVSVTNIRESLKVKIEGCKNKYWKELFDNLNKVTDRLAHSSRKKMLETLTANTQVDFNLKNIYAILTWVIKNANQYFDSQLVSVMEGMIEQANIVNYKSNQKTFGKEEWRYYATPKGLEKYQFDYRVVLTRMGGMSVNWINDKLELSERAGVFFDDLCTLANNIGFNTYDTERSKDFDWTSKSKKIFTYKNNQGKFVPLFEAKAFKNGNVHIQFSPKFIQNLNVEFGRLKGWLRSKEQASEETGIDIITINKTYGNNMKLEGNGIKLLGC